MRVKLGSIISEASGKLGGHHIGKNRSVNVLSTNRKKTTKPSKMQAYQKTLYKAVNAAWQALTPAQRALWNSFPSFYESGQNLFFGRNLPLLRCGLPIIFSPVNEVEPFIDNVFTATFCPSKLHLMVDYPLLIEKNTVLIVFATPVLSNGISNVSKYYRFIGSFSGSYLFPLNVYGFWSAIFGTGIGLSGSIRLQFQLMSTLSGVCSKVFSIQCIVQADIRLFINSVNSPPRLDESLDSGLSFHNFFIGSGSAGFTSAIQGSGKKLLIRTQTSNVFHVLDCDSVTESLITVPGGVTFSSAYSSKYGDFTYFGVSSGSLLYFINLLSYELKSIFLAGLLTSPFYCVFLPYFKKLFSAQTGSVVNFALGNSPISCISQNLPLTSINSEVLYVGGGCWVCASTSAKYIFHSTNNCVSWYVSLSLTSSPSTINFFNVGNGIVLMIVRKTSSTFSIYRSVDYGVSFVLVNNYSGNSAKSKYSNGPYGIILLQNTGDFAALRSVDFGLSFSLIPLQAGSYYFRDFLWLNNTTVLGLAKSASGFYKVFKSLDSGATWNIVYTDSVSLTAPTFTLFNVNLL